MKFKYQKLEDIPESLRQFYSQGADGAYYLQVDGAVDKSKLDEFRDTNVSLMKQLEAFKGVDPAKVAEMLENDRKIAEKKLIDAGDIEGLVAQRVAAMQADHKRQMDELKGKFESNQSQLEKLLIDNAVRSVAAKIGIASTAVDDVLLRAKTVFKVKDGRPVAEDSKGGVIYGKDGTNPLAIDDWAASLKESAPHLFAPSTGSGSSNHRGGPTNQGQKLSPVSKISAGLAAGGSSAIQE